MDNQKLVDILCQIGIELSAEKNIDRLLAYILKTSMTLSGADAGSIYKIEMHEGQRMLEFKHTANLSVDFPFQSFFMPLNLNSIAGACAVNKAIYNFNTMDDTQRILGIKHQKHYDEMTGYHTMNMLVVPLVNYEETCIGVMQLINKKSKAILLKEDVDYGCIVPFTEQDAFIIGSLASQTAILIERQELYKNINLLIDSLTESLSKAIEQRDPVTGGHSHRVATYCTHLAAYLHKKNPEKYPFSEDEIRELYIAGLLHDVGKIGVPEKLLLKAHKLSESEMHAIDMRFKYLDLLIKDQGQMPLGKAFKDLFLWLEGINRSGFLNDADEDALKSIASLSYQTPDGDTIHLLSQKEYEQLSVKKGNLTNEERMAIQNHVVFSYELLKDIRWTKDLTDVPEIAVTHHEKLSGKGYPYGVTADALSVRSRIIAIADIYDALTAKDRPYKPALPKEKSFSILKEEAKYGGLDEELVIEFMEMIDDMENS